jgi:putative DNA primase/helicase
MTSDFILAIQADGYNPPPHIEYGTFYRFAGTDKGSSNKAAYCKQFDETAGIYGDFSTGYFNTWFKDKDLSESDRKQYKKKIQKAKEEAALELKKDHESASTEASSIWKKSTPEIGTHKYLQVKRVIPHGIRTNGFKLVIPMYSDGNLWSIQTIDPAGKKRFLKGGKKQGCYYPLGKLDDVICLTEGFATAATIREVTGYAVACCFDAGNLKPVAVSMRKKYPDIKIIICADNDQYSEINTGFLEAIKTAREVSAHLAIPEFNNTKTKPTDFNDLYRLEGKEPVIKIIKDSLNVNQPSTTFNELKVFSDDLLPVIPLDYDALPEKITPWIKDVSTRIGCAPDFLVVCVLTILSSLLGRKVVIKPKKLHDWVVVANLFGAIVGRPSTKKSPALNESTYFINDLERSARKEYTEKSRLHDAEIKLSKIEEKSINAEAIKLAKTNRDEAMRMLASHGAENIQHPVEKRFIVHDTTVEKLAALMADNPNGLLTIRDEMSGLLSTLDRDDKAVDRAFYLQMFNGNQSYSYDRISRESVNILHCIGSILGGIQPARLKGYLMPTPSGNNDDGLLQRIQLMVYPDAIISTGKDRSPDIKAKSQLTRVFEYFSGLPETPDNELPEALNFTPDAQEIFYEWESENTDKAKKEKCPAMESHLSKYPAFISSLALIIHLSDKQKITPVNDKSLLKAVGLVEYFESHARRIYAMANKPDHSARSLASKLSVLLSPFSLNDFGDKGWSGLKTSDDRKEALLILKDRGYIAEEKQPVNNHTRHKAIYIINPELENY